MGNLPALITDRGITPEAYSVMKQVLYPGAQDTSIALVYDYCKARGLDPLKKPVHIVPIYDKTTKKMVDTIWPSIAEVRITAARTGLYAGKDRIVYGPEMKKSFQKQKWDDVKKTYVNDGPPSEVTFPEYAEITVYKMVAGTRCPYTQRVYWLETYARTKGDAPNDMWQKRPYGQIEKCAEAAALRSAFPEEIGSDYIAEEAHHVESVMKDVTPPEPKPVTTTRLDNIAAAKKPTIEDVPDAKPASKPHWDDGDVPDDGIM